VTGRSLYRKEEADERTGGMGIPRPYVLAGEGDGGRAVAEKSGECSRASGARRVSESEEGGPESQNLGKCDAGRIGAKDRES